MASEKRRERDLRALEKETSAQAGRGSRKFPEDPKHLSRSEGKREISPGEWPKRRRKNKKTRMSKRTCPPSKVWQKTTSGGRGERNRRTA